MGKSQLEQWQNANPEKLKEGDKKRKETEETIEVVVNQWREEKPIEEKKPETEAERILREWQESQ